DGWSMRIMTEEVRTIYAAYCRGEHSPLNDLPIQYADYAVWQREYLQGEMLERQLRFWKRQLEGLRPLELPSDRPKSDFLNDTAEYLPVDIASDLTLQLKALSRQKGVTLFMTLLAGLRVLLSHFSSQTDLVVGTSVANRNHAGIED